MKTRVARAVGLAACLAATVAPWGLAYGGLGRRLLRPFGYPGVLAVFPAILFLVGTGLLAWVLALIVPRVRLIVGTYRGFLLVLALAWIAWARSLLAEPEPLRATWGGWAFAAALVTVVIAEIRLGGHVGAGWVVVPWAVLGIIAVAVVVPLTVASLRPKPAEPRNLEAWAGPALDPLIVSLEEHRLRHGSYPSGIAMGVSCEGFPGANARAWGLIYAENGLDDFALGVIVEYKPDPFNMACHTEKRIGFLTTYRGGAAPPPPYLGTDFSFFYGGRLCGTSGRWSIWEERPQARVSGGAGVLDLADALEDADPALRAAAASAMGRNMSTVAVAPLARVLSHDPDPLVRDRAAWALGRLGDAWALSVLSSVRQEPSVAWAIARIKAEPRQGGVSRGESISRWGFEGPRNEWPWRTLGGAPLPVASADAAYEGTHGWRVGSGQAACCGASPYAHFAYGFALKLDSGQLDFGFVERLGGANRFFDAFRVDGDRIEFRGVETLQLGAFPKGKWVVLAAELDFVACTAVLRVQGEVVAEGVRILPHRFDLPGDGPVEASRIGVAASGEACVDEIWIRSWGEMLNG